MSAQTFQLRVTTAADTAALKTVQKELAGVEKQAKAAESAFEKSNRIYSEKLAAQVALREAEEKAAAAAEAAAAKTAAANQAAFRDKAAKEAAFDKRSDSDTKDLLGKQRVEQNFLDGEALAKQKRAIEDMGKSLAALAPLASTALLTIGVGIWKVIQNNEELKASFDGIGEGIGRVTEQIGKSFINSTIGMKNFREVADAVNIALGGVSEAQRKMAEPFKGWGPSTETAKQKINELKKALEDFDRELDRERQLNVQTSKIEDAKRNTRDELDRREFERDKRNIQDDDTLSSEEKEEMLEPLEEAEMIRKQRAAKEARAAKTKDAEKEQGTDTKALEKNNEELSKAQAKLVAAKQKDALANQLRSADLQAPKLDEAWKGIADPEERERKLQDKLANEAKRRQLAREMDSLMRDNPNLAAPKELESLVKELQEKGKGLAGKLKSSQDNVELARQDEALGGLIDEEDQRDFYEKLAKQQARRAEAQRKQIEQADKATKPPASAGSAGILPDQSPQNTPKPEQPAPAPAPESPKGFTPTPALEENTAATEANTAALQAQGAGEGAGSKEQGAGSNEQGAGVGVKPSGDSGGGNKADEARARDEGRKAEARGKVDEARSRDKQRMIDARVRDEGRKQKARSGPSKQDQPDRSNQADQTELKNHTKATEKGTRQQEDLTAQTGRVADSMEAEAAEKEESRGTTDPRTLKAIGEGRFLSRNDRKLAKENPVLAAGMEGANKRLEDRLKRDPSKPYTPPTVNGPTLTREEFAAMPRSDASKASGQKFKSVDDAFASVDKKFQEVADMFEGRAQSMSDTVGQVVTEASSSLRNNNKILRNNKRQIQSVARDTRSLMSQQRRSRW